MRERQSKDSQSHLNRRTVTTSDLSHWHPVLPSRLRVRAWPSSPPLRSMELESVGLGGAAAFREVRVQSVVVEFLLTHVEVLFSDTFTSAGLDPAGMFSPSPDVLATAPQCQGCSGRAGGLLALSLLH